MEMRLSVRPLALLSACLITGWTAQLRAQAADANPAAPPEPPPSATRPGRDPSQPIDEEYTSKIKRYTTETFFLSPLVDYLPASKSVPTPAAVLGDIAGAEGKLPYTKEVYEYMRLLAKSTPRVKVYSIGTSEEGREMLAIAVSGTCAPAKPGTRSSSSESGFACHAGFASSTTRY